jgi:DNA-binding HxlR family transcriptional regulator
MVDPAAEPLRLGFGVVGKHLFRIRERHIAEHLTPLIAGRASGAAKLDLVLRCAALLPRDAGNREPGTVLSRCSWELLHDLARPADQLGAAPPGMDPPESVRKLKRKWVGEQLSRLEELGLLRREMRPGKRPKLVVLRDDGSGDPFDDPDGTAGNTYVSILGAVIASRALAKWGAPELAAYLAAMVGERHASPRPTNPGTGKWFRSLAWFADVDGFYGPDDRVKIAFSEATLERGLKNLERNSLISRKRISVAPGTNRRLSGPRNLYSNNFATLRAVPAPVDDLEEPDGNADE